jgi:2-polyprenyl-6-methoxyphenol hydroxylase-like FAD-dependent oxidoreductase
MALRISIVVGGLGGLAAALFLRKAGLDATVYEQMPELREVGAGIVIPPNMVRPLVSLGLARDLQTFAVRLEARQRIRDRRPAAPKRMAVRPRCRGRISQGDIASRVPADRAG